MTCNLYSSIEAAKEAMEKLSTETKEYFERQTELTIIMLKEVF